MIVNPWLGIDWTIIQMNHNYQTKCQQKSLQVWAISGNADFVPGVGSACVSSEAKCLSVHKGAQLYTSNIGIGKLFPIIKW